MFAAPKPVLNCGGRELLLDQPRIMGVINVTPDSFSDGGQFADAQAAIDYGLQLLAEGADLLDVGGESTRPGAEPVPLEVELARVLPVIEGLARRCSVPISVDSSRPEVMRAAVAAGAGLINDVRALRLPGALDAAAESGAAIVLMHMQGEPGSMQQAPAYDEVVAEVQRFLTDRILACRFAGIDQKRIVIDPGFGFGKTLEHNLELLGRLSQFQVLACPLLAGLSRKRMIGALTGREAPQQRVAGSVAAALIAVQQGAQIVRVHDVAATRDALAVWNAVRPRIQAPAKASSKPAAASLFDDD
ncbi:MAG: dihydropteroate synthase [Lysobacterales bacterium]